MRTRTRTELHTYPEGRWVRQLSWRINGTAPGGTDVSDSPIFQTSATHVIEDEECQKKQYGNCRHTVTETLALPYDAVILCTPNGIGFTRDTFSSYYYAYTAWAIPGVQTVGHFGWTQPTYSVDWANLSAQAMESMLPSMKTDNSLVNFILELKDLASITKVWRKKRSKLKNSASVNLGLQFGLIPFVSDVQALVNALRSFQKRLKELQKAANKPITRHYRRGLDVFKLPSDAVLGSTGGPLRCWRIARWEEPPMYTATVRYRYQMPDLGLLSNRIKAMLDSLGVRPDASILWNAIPFSFIVDWFFDVGGWLESLSSDNLDIPVHIDDFCHSIKVDYTIELHMQRKYDYPVNGALYTDLHKVLMKNISHYERRRAIPSTHLDTAVQRGPLSTNKIVLGTSLIAANTNAELPRLPKPKWHLMIRPWIPPSSRLRY